MAAALGARSAPKDTGNQTRGSAGTSRGGAPWLVLSLLLVTLPAHAQDRAAVEAELDRLRRDLGIPALSAAVVEGGTTVWVRHLGFKAASGEAIRYSIASLTKPFAAALAMQLVERGALTLDGPAGDSGASRSIRQLLTHTSTHPPGQRFIYSSELFRMLQPALQKGAGQPLASALASHVFRPSGLRRTVAPPRTTPSTGVESTVEDLARFAMAMERGPLLSSQVRLEMFRPPRGPTGQALPYALGWFVQYIGGEEVRWHFGEQAESSSLLLMLPRKRLTLVVLARTERLSSPFWLQMGDVRWSPFAAAFLTGWAKVRIDLAEARRVMMQALVAIHGRRPREARGFVAKALGLAPALGDSADGSLLAAFARSGDPELRATARRIAKRLISVDGDHPRTLLDLAVLNLQDSRPDEAKRLLQQAMAGNRATPEILSLSRQLLDEIATTATDRVVSRGPPPLHIRTRRLEGRAGVAGGREGQGLPVLRVRYLSQGNALPSVHVAAVDRRHLTGPIDTRVPVAPPRRRVCGEAAWQALRERGCP